MGNYDDKLPLSHATFEVAGVLIRKKVTRHIDKDDIAVLRGIVAVRVGDDLIETRIYIKEYLNNIRNKQYDIAIETLKQVEQGEGILISGRYSPATYWSKLANKVISGQHQFHAEDFQILVAYDPAAIVQMDFYPRKEIDSSVKGYINTRRGLEPVKLQTIMKFDCDSIYSVQAAIRSKEHRYELELMSYTKLSKQYDIRTLKKAESDYRKRLDEISTGK